MKTLTAGIASLFILGASPIVAQEQHIGYTPQGVCVTEDYPGNTYKSYFLGNQTLDIHKDGSEENARLSVYFPNHKRVTFYDDDNDGVLDAVVDSNLNHLWPLVLQMSDVEKTEDVLRLTDYMESFKQNRQKFKHVPHKK
ncbi:MAG: hypothetical protein P8X70_02785 [Nanoarchaeota archaeon]